MRRALPLFAGAFLLLSCGDRGPVSPDGDGFPSASVTAGTAGDHFAFLPPLLNTPPLDGEFNPNLAPTVVVCDPSGAEACGTERARWTSVNGTGSERVRVVPEDEAYIVNWHGNAFQATAGETYRIRVLLGSTVLGTLDVFMYTNQKDAKAAEANGQVALRVGRTVPIKFRIETGALAAALGTVCTSDCTEAAVPPGQETTVTTPSEEGGVQFSPEALENEPEPVNITITTIEPGTNGCLVTDLQQYRECFRVTVDRSIALAPNTVVVGVCLDPAILAQDRHNVTIYKQSEDENGNPVGTVKPLEERAAPFLDCDNVQAFGGSNHPAARLARAGLRLLKPLVDAVAPAQLHAYDGGIGCDPAWELNELGLDDAPFSRFGWVRPVTMNGVAGDGQVAAAGTTLPVAPSVQVWEAHGPPNTVAPDVPVRFTFEAPDQTQTVVDIFTDANGVATVPWTLGAALGTYTVTITAPGTNIEATPVPTVVYTATADLLLTARSKAVHWWPGEGNFADEAGNASGTAVNGTGFGTGVVGQAFSFDGSDDYIEFGTAASLGGSVNFSLEAWVMTDATTGQTIINQRSAPLANTSGFVGEYILNIGTTHSGGTHTDDQVPVANKVYFMVFAGAFQWELVSNVDVNDGQWHHIVAVRHGANGYIYVDGVASATGSGSVQHLDPNIPVYVGADVRDFNFGANARKAFDGLIDEVAIYDHPLSAAEVLALCQAGGGCQ